MITTTTLTRSFRRPGGEEVQAVRGVDLQIWEGETVAILGPNGAGKSTLMRMLSTLLPPTSGTATVAGFDVTTQGAQVRAQIGYVGQGNGAGHTQRAIDEVVTQGRIYGLNRADARQRADELLGVLGLTQLAARKTQAMSGGQRRRLDLAIGLVNNPPLLFLDESNPEMGVMFVPPVYRLRAGSVRPQADRGRSESASLVDAAAPASGRNEHHPPRRARPFHHRAALAMLAAHAIPGVEELDGTTYRRILTIDGEPTRVTITLHPCGVTAVTDTTPGDTAPVAALIRRWFDLDTDTASIDQTLAADQALAPLIARRPGLRLVGYPDEFEAVAATVIGQQVSLAAARTFASRLVTAHGSVHDDLYAFPAPTVLAHLGPEGIQKCAGLTHARARTLYEVSRRWADSPLLQGLAAEDARRLLLDIPGVGPWTADYLLVRALQHPDTFAPGDLVARRALGLDQKTAAARSQAWAPYRSYALLHLWTDAAYL